MVYDIKDLNLKNNQNILVHVLGAKQHQLLIGDRFRGVDVQILQDPNHLVRNPHMVTNSDPNFYGGFNDFDDDSDNHLMRYESNQLASVANAHAEHCNSSASYASSLMNKVNENDYDSVFLVRGHVSQLPVQNRRFMRGVLNTNQDSLHGLLQGDPQEAKKKMDKLMKAQHDMTCLVNYNYESLTYAKNFKYANDKLMDKLSDHFMGYMNYACDGNIKIERMKDKLGEPVHDRFNVTFKNDDKHVNKTFKNVDLHNLVTGIVDASKRGIIPLTQKNLRENFVAVAQATDTKDIVKPLTPDDLKHHHPDKLAQMDAPESTNEINFDNGPEM